MYHTKLLEKKIKGESIEQNGSFCVSIEGRDEKKNSKRK